MQSSLLVGRLLKMIGVVLFILIFSYIDRNKILLILEKIDLWLLTISIILNLPQLFIKSFRWNYLLKQQHTYVSLKKTFLIYLNSIYLGIITPGRIGEFSKVLFLKNDFNIDMSRGFSSVLVDRIFDLYLLISIGIIGIWKFELFGFIPSGFYYALFFIIFSPLLILNQFFLDKCVKVLFTLVVKKKNKAKINQGFEKFNYSIRQLINYNLINSFLLTLLSYLIFFTQCFLLALALDLSINFILLTLIMAITNLISFIPITVSGLGTREAILILLFSLIGFDSEYAVSYSIIIFSVFYIGGAILGLIAWMINPLDLKIIKK